MWLERSAPETVVPESREDFHAVFACDGVLASGVVPYWDLPFYFKAQRLERFSNGTVRVFEASGALQENASHNILFAFQTLDVSKTLFCATNPSFSSKSFAASMMGVANFSLDTRCLTVAPGSSWTFSF